MTRAWTYILPSTTSNGILDSKSFSVAPASLQTPDSKARASPALASPAPAVEAEAANANSSDPTKTVAQQHFIVEAFDGIQRLDAGNRKNGFNPRHVSTWEQDRNHHCRSGHWRESPGPNPERSLSPDPRPGSPALLKNEAACSPAAGWLYLSIIRPSFTAP
ncbi:MAG TPA: hypothetical protein VGK80_11300 [Rhodanobacteraceae bacterium]